MAKAKHDTYAKRADENHLQWRARIARIEETRRRQGEDTVTPEARRHGLSASLVRDDEGRTWQSYRRKGRSALAYMRERGNLSDDQFHSAQRIAEIAEMLERTVAVTCASLEARVDCSGSARNAINESLYRVRAEGAYTEWRSRLPLPRRMVIDRGTQGAGITAIASQHNMGWPKAQSSLKAALDRWPEIVARYVKAIDQDDRDQQHAKLRA